MNKDNTVFLRGRIIRDAELKESKRGAAVCDFAVSVPKADGAANSIDLSLFGMGAKGFYPRLRKDVTVVVSGHLEQPVWENEEGRILSRLRVVIDDPRVEEAEGGEGVGENAGSGF
jgi:single-stranded DNA-binding protein